MNGVETEENTAATNERERNRKKGGPSSSKLRLSPASIDPGRRFVRFDFLSPRFSGGKYYIGERKSLDSNTF